MSTRASFCQSSEFGSGRGGWGSKGQIVREGKPVTNNSVDAVITFTGSPPTSGYGVTVQLVNADLSPIAHCQPFRIRIVADAAGAALAVTGGSTGLAIGANGGIDKTVTSKLIFDCVTDNTGKATFTWTDTAHEVAYLAVVLPNGLQVFSDALTTA